MSMVNTRQGGNLAEIEATDGLIRVKSGFVQSQDINRLLRAGLHTGVLEGIEKGFAEWQGTIALRTGEMRQAIRKMMVFSIGKPGSPIIDINLDSIVSLATTLVFYTQYHYEVLAGTGLPYYKHPTTIGTKPFTKQDFMMIFPAAIDAGIRNALRKLGFDVAPGAGPTARRSSIRIAPELIGFGAGAIIGSILK